MTENTTDKPDAVYISGPMTGIPAYNFPMFYAAERALTVKESYAWNCIANPARYDAMVASIAYLTPQQQGERLLRHPELFDLHAAQRHDIEVITNQVSVMCMLPGWEASVGARAEAHMALWLGHDFLFYIAEADDFQRLTNAEMKAYLMGGAGILFIPETIEFDFNEVGEFAKIVPCSPICCPESTVANVTATPINRPEDEPCEDPDYWARERQDVLDRFAAELSKATGDGSKKRQSGEKPPWYEDGSHEGAIFSHITKWKRGEQVDPDSGAHPLVHAAWRALAIACSESGNHP